ncbi:MAG: hypothetical protein OES47_03235 [Acidobacteriota bacterium]|nr:hypothetical protein [Acidobacteriota bacterium]
MSVRAHKSLALPLVVWLVLQVPVSAAVITVSTASGCTLTDAITAANTGVATGSCPAGAAAGPDRIVLTGGITLTSVDNTTDGNNGLPSITSEITIQGDGHEVSRSTLPATPRFRIFHIAASGDLTLLDTTVSDGSASQEGVTAKGGGLFNRGALALIYSTVSDNGTNDNNAEGGGIHNAGGTVALTHTTVSGNFAFGIYAEGGGIHNASGALRATNSTLSNNTASGTEYGYGGGIYNGFGTVVLKNTTLSGNRAGVNTIGYGGGIYNATGTVTLTNTTLSENHAGVNDSGLGGGAYNRAGEVTVANSTLYSNTSGLGYAEALYNGSGTMTLTRSIVTSSLYGLGDNCDGGITDGGHNFGSDDSCPRVTTSGLGIVLIDHGGPVMTHALYAGSNAVDQDPSCELLTDARGAPRDGNCDSGAFEYGADDEFEASGDNSDDDDCFGHHIPLGRAERHLHRQDAEDWIWFEAQAGATYEIRTSNLLGATDTILTLREECGPTLATDNDGGGEPSASLITYMPATNAVLDVKISEEVGSAPQFGYDVSVTCTANCPVCPLPGGDSFDLSDETIFSYLRIEACTSMLSTSGTTVKSGAEAILRVGQRAEFENGFNVEKDARLTVAIDPDLLP